MDQFTDIVNASFCFLTPAFLVIRAYGGCFVFAFMSCKDSDGSPTDCIIIDLMNDFRQRHTPTENKQIIRLSFFFLLLYIYIYFFFINIRYQFNPVVILCKMNNLIPCFKYFRSGIWIQDNLRISLDSDSNRVFHHFADFAKRLPDKILLQYFSAALHCFNIYFSVFIVKNL